MTIWRRGGVALAAVTVIAGAAGCQSDGGAKAGASGEKKPQAQSQSSVTDLVTAAYKKTAAAKSAKVRMTMKMPASAAAGGAASPFGAGGTMEMNGTMGWDPIVMDMTMDGSMLDGEAGAPDKVRMVWADNIMYMDMGADAAKEMEGKRWMKLDIAGAAKAAQGKDGAAADGAAATGTLTGGLDKAGQDPAQQLAMLLDSPNLKHLGAETVDGVRAEHFKGRFTLDEMVKANKSLDVLSPKEHKDLVDTMKKAGLKSYDTEVWVNKDDYPVRMDVVMATGQGDMNVSTHYSDYGAKAEVTPPPADQTFDLMEMMAAIGADPDAAAGA